MKIPSTTWLPLPAWVHDLQFVMPRSHTLSSSDGSSPEWEDDHTPVDPEDALLVSSLRPDGTYALILLS